MSKTEYFNFCQKLAFHAAPTLLGIKCASLVSLSAGLITIGSVIPNLTSISSISVCVNTLVKLIGFLL